MKDYEKTRARIDQFHMVKGFAQDLHARYRAYRAQVDSASKYFVTVEDTDDLYDKVLKLLTERIPPEQRRSLVCETEASYDPSIDGNVYSLLVNYEDKFTTTLDVDGHRIKVKITQEKSDAENGSVEVPSLMKVLAGAGMNMRAPSVSSEVSDQIAQAMTMGMGGPNTTFAKRVMFTCDSLDAREAVLKKLTELATSFNEQKRQSRFYVAGIHGWNRRSAIMDRPADSVILRGNDRERIAADLRDFLQTEEKYIELGQPWHHGYLFWGPPGTGKTTIARWLASEFHHDVYYLPLSAVKDDAQLQDLVGGISGDRAFLVIEDIDIIHAARERDDKDSGVTMQGLLNCLDGIGTPHGLITVMTTNRREVLDPALIRDGRVDFELEVGYMDDDQLDQMVRRFHGKPLELPSITTGQITPSEVVGLFLKSWDDETLATVIGELIERRNNGEPASTKIQAGSLPFGKQNTGADVQSGSPLAEWESQLMGTYTGTVIATTNNRRSIT